MSAVSQEPIPSREVTLSVRLVAHGAERSRMVETLRSALTPVRGYSGCLQCNLMEDILRPGEVQLLVELRGEEEFLRFVRSTDFRRILHGIDLAEEQPDLRIRTIERTRGMDLLEEILLGDDGGQPPSRRSVE